MSGVVIVSSEGLEIARVRYGSKNGRKSILSFLNVLYALTSYTITISPDDCTEDQTVAQCAKAGCYKGYMRAGCVYGVGWRSDSAVDYSEVR
jgi:hypothetical protein